MENLYVLFSSLFLIISRHPKRFIAVLSSFSIYVIAFVPEVERLCANDIILRRSEKVKLWKKREPKTASNWYEDNEDDRREEDWQAFWKETNQKAQSRVPAQSRTFKGSQYEPVEEDYVPPPYLSTGRWGNMKSRSRVGDRFRDSVSTDDILGKEFSDAIVETADGRKMYEDPALNLQDLEFGDDETEDEELDDSDEDDEDCLFYNPALDTENLSDMEDDDEEDPDDSASDLDDAAFFLDSSYAKAEKDPQYTFSEEMKHPSLDPALFGNDLLSRNLNLKITSQALEQFEDSKQVLEKEPRPTFSFVMVGAVPPALFRSMKGSLGNWGVDFKLNIHDWEHTPADSKRSLEDIAVFKARRMFEATGLPCISEATGFEIEPTYDGLGSRQNARYRFNRMGPHVNKLIEILGPTSDPDRVCSYKTVMCFFDGELQLLEYGDCDCAIVFADEEKDMISKSLALTSLIDILSEAFNFNFLPEGMRTVASLKNIGDDTPLSASTLLRDRILKDAVALPGRVIDVSKFMDSSIDVNLMQECAKELAKRFLPDRPNKILTVATTGLVLALPMAAELQIPVVYARKQRSLVMSETYHAFYNSRTKGGKSELFLSKTHIDPEDRVLIVDDFLSSGGCQEALMRIVLEAGAVGVGVAVLVEKVYDAGRTYLAGHNIPIHSLAKIVSVEDGMIEVLEE